jgi:hypothetical protein
MSVHYDSDRRRFAVRWREEGRQRSKRTEQEAVDFDARVGGAGRPRVDPPANDVVPTRAGGDGVYAWNAGVVAAASSGSNRCAANRRREHGSTPPGEDAG